MKKVEAINAECRQGMINTELAFIEAGRQAAVQAKAISARQISAAAAGGNLHALPVPQGFFAEHATTADALLMTAQQ